MTDDSVKPGVWMTLEDGTHAVAEAWTETLARISPVLASEAAHEEVRYLAAALVELLLDEPFDAEHAVDVGRRLEMLQGLQPDDLVDMQIGLVRALSDAMPPEMLRARQEDISHLAIVLGAGYYAAQCQRSALRTTELAAQMGHDLKTPINAITGFSRVILKGIDGPITDLQREDLTSVYESGRSLLTIIGDICAVQKQDAGRSPIRGAVFQLSELLGDVFVTVQPIAAERNQAFQLISAGDLGSVSQDYTSVRWVLLCLLLHLVRQMEAGQICLYAARHREAGSHPGDDAALFVLSNRPIPSLGLDSAESPWNDAVRSRRNVDVWPDEIGLKTTRRLCDDMGGSVVMTVSGDGEPAFLVKLPVRNTPDRSHL